MFNREGLRVGWRGSHEPKTMVVASSEQHWTKSSRPFSLETTVSGSKSKMRWNWGLRPRWFVLGLRG
jgi:hypothetical protein